MNGDRLGSWVVNKIGENLYEIHVIKWGTTRSLFVTIEKLKNKIRSRLPTPGGGGTTIYGLYRYVPL